MLNGDIITLHKDGGKILRKTDGTVVEFLKDEKGELQVVKNAEGSVLMRMRASGADSISGMGNEVQFLEFGDGTPPTPLNPSPDNLEGGSLYSPTPSPPLSPSPSLNHLT